MTRKCGDCSLCCTLLPVSEIGKKADIRCQHQRHRKGCAVYRTGIPGSCKLWICAWLSDADGAPLRRPDHCHYVVDMMLDYIRIQPHDGSPEQRIPCVQVWCDPKYPDAWKDKALFAFLDIRAAQGFVAVIRHGSQKAFVLAPPRMTGADGWAVINGGMGEREHTAEEVASVMAEAGIAVEMRFAG